MSLLMNASTAHAVIREYQVVFEASPSPSVTGYTLHVGSESGSYSGQIDIGEPVRSGSQFQHRAAFDHDVDLFVAISAYDAQGRTSLPSQEVRLSATAASPSLPTGSPAPYMPPVALDGAAQIGIATGQWGMVSAILANGSNVPLTFHSLAASGDVRAARCDLDADGEEDLVLGFGPGSGGTLVRIHMRAGKPLWYGTTTAGTAYYALVDGQTRPACGDLDGDGRNELAIGFGPGAGARVQILDDIWTNFLPKTVRGRADGMLSIPGFTGPGGGALYPALGDIDGDGRDELVVGFGVEGRSEVAILDDGLTGFAAHPNFSGSEPVLRITGPNAPNGSGGSAYPALGDWDGDGRDEIAVGFGSGSGGWVALIEDAAGPAYDSRTTWPMIAVGREWYRAAWGETRPAFADLDGNGVDEMVVGFSGAASRELQVVPIPSRVSSWVVQDEVGFETWGSPGSHILIPSPAAAP